MQIKNVFFYKTISIYTPFLFMKSYQVCQFAHHGSFKKGHNTFMIIKLLFKCHVNMWSDVHVCEKLRALYFLNANLSLIPITGGLQLEMSTTFLLKFVCLYPVVVALQKQHTPQLAYQQKLKW
jgi:hypothetical protein